MKIWDSTPAASIRAGVLFFLFVFAWIWMPAGPRTSPAGMSVASGILYVDDDAPPGGDGHDWASAIQFLQQALQLAADPVQGVTEIRVAGGIYRPDRYPAAPLGSGDRAIAFPLLPGVAMRGGYAGWGAPDPGVRDTGLYPTVLSGDLLADDGPGAVNIVENSTHVLISTEADAASLLDGFIIRGGNAQQNSGTNRTGAGLLIVSGNPVIANCVFEGNYALMGAAIGNQSGTPVLDHCSFTGNRASFGRGGAIYIAAGSLPVITGCVFTANVSSGGSGVGDGGAIFIETGSPVRITGCTFRNNISRTVGMVTPTGGAITNLSDNVTIVNCVFGANQSYEGGAVWNGGDGVRLINCTFAGNTATSGGAVLVFPSRIDLIGCTLTANIAADGGGISNGLFSILGVHNCVVWGNTGDQAGTAFLNQIHNNGGTIALSYSCIQGVLTPAPGEDPPNPADFPGCTESDPLFLDAGGPDHIAGTADDNLRLNPASPAIDAGDNGRVSAEGNLDLDGRPRRWDDRLRPDTGFGPAPVVDMGAYEFRPGDQNGSGRIDSVDLGALLTAWGPCAGCPEDINGDGRVDYADLGILLAGWN